MKVSKEQITEWIEMYLNSDYAKNVLTRELSRMMIHRLQCDRKDESGVNVSVRWLEFINKNLSVFDKCKDFKSIYEQVEKFANDFYGIGELTIYDTATCIGCPKKLFPAVVYKHCGTAKGANALGIRGRKIPKNRLVTICDAFEKLEPIQIEDFLCIFSHCLMADEQGCKELHEKLKKKIDKKKKSCKTIAHC